MIRITEIGHLHHQQQQRYNIFRSKPGGGLHTHSLFTTSHAHATGVCVYICVVHVRICYGRGYTGT